MRLPVLVLTLVLPLSGCLGGPGGTPPADTDAAPGNNATAPPPVPWSVSADFALGWIVGAGSNLPTGELIVGLYASGEGQCPRYNFYVPPEAERVEIAVEAPQGVDAGRPGAGSYTFVISNPAGIYFILPPLDDDVWEFDAPEPGVWDVWVNPNGAAVNLAWPVHVQVDGVSPVPPGELALKKDGDCMP